MVYFSIICLLLRVIKHFIRFMITRFARINSYDHQHIWLLLPQILVLKLSELETPTVYYMCFQMLSLRSIFVPCVRYKIWLKMVLFRPFIPNLVNSGERFQTALDICVMRRYNNEHFIYHYYLFYVRIIVVKNNWPLSIYTFKMHCVFVILWRKW